MEFSSREISLDHYYKVRSLKRYKRRGFRELVGEELFEGVNLDTVVRPRDILKKSNDGTYTRMNYPACARIRIPESDIDKVDRKIILDKKTYHRGHGIGLD